MDWTTVWVAGLAAIFLLVIGYQFIEAFKLLFGAIADRIRVRGLLKAFVPAPGNRVFALFLFALAVFALVGRCTLVPLDLCFRAYGLTAACAIVWIVRTVPPSERLFEVVTRGLFGLAPAGVALLFLLNMVPRHVHAEQHRLAATRMWSSHSKGRYGPSTHPLMDFTDDAFSDWHRARERFNFPPEGTRYVRFTMGDGLLGFPVIYRRQDLDEQGRPMP